MTVEFIFAYPGLGSLFVNAVASRDLPLVEGIALLFATVYVLLNLIADVLIVLIEPRLRTTAGVGRRG